MFESRKREDTLGPKTGGIEKYEIIGEMKYEICGIIVCEYSF